MRQLFDIVKAKEHEIYRPRHVFWLLSVVKSNIFHIVGVTLKKHFQLKRTFTATLALCIIMHHV